jgi:hypothetical protein
MEDPRNGSAAALEFPLIFQSRNASTNQPQLIVNRLA